MLIQDPGHASEDHAVIFRHFIFGFVFANYAQVAIGQIPNGFIFLALNAVIMRLFQMINKPGLFLKRKKLEHEKNYRDPFSFLIFSLAIVRGRQNIPRRT